MISRDPNKHSPPWGPRLAGQAEVMSAVGPAERLAGPGGQRALSADPLWLMGPLSLRLLTFPEIACDAVPYLEFLMWVSSFLSK